MNGREIFIDLALDVRIRYRRTERPPIEYAVTIELCTAGGWTTLMLWDNADGLDEHHEHAYTEQGGKQMPTIVSYESANEAMAAAIRKASAQWTIIVEQWRGIA